MKKILFLILTFFILTNFVNAQWPITQNLGSDSTLISVGRNFGGGIKGSLINKSYTDTTAANLSHADFYAGAQIFTTSDTSFWIRNKTATNTYWFKIGGAGGGATGSFWGLTGNYIAVTPANLGIGTNDPFNDLPFKTNNTVRLRLPLNGLERQSGGAWKPMLFDTTNLIWGYGDGGGTNWSLTGNSGTVAGTNFLGTTDSVDFVFKTNNAERIRLLAAGIPSSTSSNDSVLVRKADLSIGVIAKRALVATLQEVFDTESGGSILTKTDTIIYGGGGDGTALRYYWDRGSEGKYQTEYSHSNITYRHSGDYTAGCTSCGLNSIGLTGAIQNAAYPGGVDTSLGGFGWHNGPNDKHFFIADLTNWYAGPGIPANRYVTIEYFGMPFFGAYVNPTNDNPQMLFGRWPSWYQLGDNYQKYGFVNGETAMFVDTVFFKGNVGIGTASPDSLITVQTGIWGKRGVRFSGLSTGIPASAKRILMAADGTLYAADTTVGGGGGGTPGGNFGNIQLNRNGAFATPASDSLDFESATGLTSLGNLGVGVTTSTYRVSILDNQTTRDVIKMRNSNASGYNSIGFFSSADVQVGGFGYANSGIGAPVTDAVYFYSASKDLVFSKDATATSSMTVRGSTGTVGIASNLYVGSATGTASALAHFVSTTEQLRLGYDASNYYSTTVGSTGKVTWDAVGSGAGFVVNDVSDFADTTNFKPVVINTTGTAGTQNQLYKATYWPGGGGGGGWGTTGTVATLTGASTLAMATNTFDFSNGRTIFSTSGGASTPAISMTGNPYTAGTATTNHPLHYINGGTAPTTWSTAGTYGGINAVSGFTGNFLDYHVNGGTSVAKVDYEGTGTFKGVTIGKYGGSTGISQASGDMYFYTSSGALIYTAGSAGQRIEVAGAGAYTQNSLIYGGNTAYTRMGSNLSIFGSAGETRLGAGGTENYLTIQTDGDVGIGQTSPAARLDILKTTEQLRISYDGSNYVSNTVSSAGVLTIAPTGASVTVTKPVVLKNYTVATLPAGVQGMVAFVTDALAPAYLVTVVGGGAVVTPVFYDGTNWIAH